MEYQRANKPKKKAEETERLRNLQSIKEQIDKLLSVEKDLPETSSEMLMEKMSQLLAECSLENCDNIDVDIAETEEIIAS